MSSISVKPEWKCMGAWPLLAYIALVPGCIAAAFRYSGHDASRVLQLGILLLGSLMLALQPYRPRKGISRVSALMLAAMGALAIASVQASAVPPMAWREIALWLGLLALVMVSALAIAQDGGRAVRVAVLAGSGIQAFLLTFVTVAAALTQRPVVWTELAGGYDNYRLFNHVQTIAMPLLAGIAVRERRGSAQWWIAWISLVVYAAYVLCSGARGTSLAVSVAASLALALFGLRKAWPLTRALLLAFAAGALLYALVFLVLPAWGAYRLGATAERSMASLASDSSRLQLWHFALDQIRGSPWLGIGPMHLAHVPNPKAAHPHNIYLQVAAEWGLPMLILLLACAWRGLVRLAGMVRSATEPAAREGVMLWITSMAVLIDAAVSGNFVMPVSQVWIALCAAWALAWMRAQPDPASHAGGTPVRSWRLVGVVLVITQVWLATSVWTEASDLDAHLEHVRRDILQNAKTNPRFWSNGWF
jgi:O-antigen ligase